MAAAAGRRPLVLHFDINKTIIICDPVKGVGCDAMVNALLSEACWGTWDGAAAAPAEPEALRRAAASWRLVKGPTTEAQEGLVTYAELLEEVLRMEKKELQALKNTFTEAGQPGEAVREAFERLQAQLRLPEGVALPCAPPAVGEGRHFLLPSFLNLVLRLQAQGRDFRLVFRTFGVDTADVIREFNLFCRGEHPCYPETPAALRERAVELPNHSGEWYRDDAGLHLALCVRCGGAELVQQQHGLSQCAAALRARLFDSAAPVLTMALRDYFPYWRSHKEADDSGKVLLVEPVTDGAAHHIFFDDNIERGRAHIADARSAETGEPLPFSETQGVYLVKAEPLQAIQDPEYFVTAVEAAEEALARRAASAAS